MNLHFEYLYRDGGNFKNWGYVIFSNKQNIPIVIVSEKIIELLDEGLYFKVDDLNIPDLHFNEFNQSIDHTWHEFYGCSATNDSITDCNQRDIQTIIDRLFELNKISKYNSGLRS